MRRPCKYGGARWDVGILQRVLLHCVVKDVKQPSRILDDNQTDPVDRLSWLQRNPSEQLELSKVMSVKSVCVCYRRLSSLF